MYTDRAYDHFIYDDIENLIKKKNYFIAKEKLDELVNRTSKWHFLYSKVLLHMAWFDSAKKHLETAMSIYPGVIEYKDAYIELMARPNRYGSSPSDQSSNKQKKSCTCCDNTCCYICTDNCTNGCFRECKGECAGACAEGCVEICLFSCCEHICENLDCS